jgi:hypothetical protein
MDSIGRFPESLDDVFARLHADPSYWESIERGWLEYELGMAVPLTEAVAEVDAES